MPSPDLPPFQAGQRVRPAADGETMNWTRLRGTVADIWRDGNGWCVEVSWRHPSGNAYGRNVPDYLLEVADA